MRFFLRLIDRMVPASLLEAPVRQGTRLFQTRVTIGLSVLLPGLLLSYVPIRVAIGGEMSGTVWFLPVSGLVLALLPLWIRKTGDHILPAVLIQLLGLVMIPIRALATGGMSSSATAWMMLGPVLASTTLPRRWALGLSALTLAVLTGIFVLDDLGYVQTVDPAPLARLVNDVMLLAMFFLIAVLHFNEREGHTRRLEGALEGLEQASRAKAEFFAAMSHELRTPLNGVMGMSQLLADSEHLDAEERTWVDTLDSSAALLLTLIDDILDVSRLEAGKLQLERTPFSPSLAVREVTALLRPKARDKGLALRTEVRPEVPALLLGDDIRFRQVLLNLAGNAVKFTSEGEVVVGLAWEGGQLVLSVADTGIGIPEEAQQRIFERFSQADASTSRRFGGSGLGLAISQGLTELMGGHISLESTPGEGATFTVHLPMVAAARPSPEPTPKRTRVTASARILVVDDNPVNRTVARAFLVQMGHQVVLAESGEQALDALAEQPFDLVLMDCEMPEMDGYETTRRIRAAHGRRLPVLALTAHAFPEAIQRSVAAGMNAHLTKPLVREVLSEELQRFLPPDEQRAAR